MDSDWTFYRELTDTLRELRDRRSKERARNDAVRERARRREAGAITVRLHRRRRAT